MICTSLKERRHVLGILVLFDLVTRNGKKFTNEVVVGLNLKSSKVLAQQPEYIFRKIVF